MASLFGYPDRMRAGVSLTVNTGAAVDTMPAEYLYDPQPGLRARFTPDAGTLAITFDFGASVSIGLVMLVNTTLTGDETVRLYLNDGDPTFSSGNLSNTVHSATGATRTRGAAVCLLPADITARYMRLLITDISPAVLDIGGVSAMPTLRLERGIGFGMSEGRRSLGVMDYNEYTGAEFRVSGLAQPRYADFSLPSVSAAEYHGTLRDMIADVGLAEDVAWCPDDAMTQGELNARVLLGGIKRPGEDIGIVRDRPLRANVRFRLVERL